jgi:putative transposase
MAQLQEENLRLKKLVAELSLDKTMLHEVLSKNGEAFAAWTDGQSADEQLWSE